MRDLKAFLLLQPSVSALSVLLARDPQECFESIVKGTAHRSDHRCYFLLGFQRHFCRNPGSIRTGQRTDLAGDQNRHSRFSFCSPGFHSYLPVFHQYRNRCRKHSCNVFHALSHRNCVRLPTLTFWPVPSSAEAVLVTIWRPSQTPLSWLLPVWE